MAEVDDFRISHLADLYLATGQYSAAQAIDLATIEYAAYIGLRVVGSNRTPHERTQLYEALSKLTSRPR